jgi:hypothetical protein
MSVFMSALKFLFEILRQNVFENKLFVEEQQKLRQKLSFIYKNSKVSN